MAHTDRDRDRWMRHNHNNEPCVFDEIKAIPWAQRIWFPWSSIHCEVCEGLWSGKNRRRFYISTAAYSEWAKDCRREERSRAKTAMRECRDWDDLVINYRRPYFD